MIIRHSKASRMLFSQTLVINMLLDQNEHGEFSGESRSSHDSEDVAMEDSQYAHDEPDLQSLYARDAQDPLLHFTYLYDFPDHMDLDSLSLPLPHLTAPLPHLTVSLPYLTTSLPHLTEEL